MLIIVTASIGILVGLVAISDIGRPGDKTRTGKKDGDTEPVGLGINGVSNVTGREGMNGNGIVKRRK